MLVRVEHVRFVVSSYSEFLLNFEKIYIYNSEILFASLKNLIRSIFTLAYELHTLYPYHAQ